MGWVSDEAPPLRSQASPCVALLHTAAVWLVACRVCAVWKARSRMSAITGTRAYQTLHKLRDLEIAHRQAAAGHVSWESLEQEIRELRVAIERLVASI